MRWIVVLAVATAILVVDASRLTPPVLPLIVRNPYLSTWLANARDVPWEHWPMFWTGQRVGLSVLARVPDSGAVYPLLGRPQDSFTGSGESFNISYPIYKGATFDASTTNLSYYIPTATPQGLPAELTISFLSPITPTSTLRQSLPAAYISIYVKGNFNIEIYIDINGEWVSGNTNNEITWEIASTHMPNDPNAAPPLRTWKIKRAQEQLFTEVSDRGEWGVIQFTGPHDVKYEAGSSAQVRRRFARVGTLQNENEGHFRSILEEEPVFAFSKSFKLRENSTETLDHADSVMFTIAHIQDPIVQFASARGLTFMKPLWESWFPTVDSLLTYHFLDFQNAFRLSNNYSTQLAIDALKSGSEDYKDILALSARQVLGATSFSGTPDNPIVFLKEISSNGDFQTVDVIFPSFPFFLYTNPRWLAYLLEPLIEHQLSGQYPNMYSMHDMGVFPNATGHSDGNDEYMPVEECGDMLIMGLALVNSLKYDTQPASIWSACGAHSLDTEAGSAFPLKIDKEGLDDSWGGPVSGKGTKQARKWIGRSYRLWKQWTGYLVRESLIPSNQLSTDDFAGWLANQTNLALKGIIGIKAMSEISSLLGETHDAKYYRNISDVYIKKWEEYGMSRDGTHAKLAYTWYGSWTTIYNLFADSLLCFHLPSTSHRLERENAFETQQPLEDPDKSNTSRTAFVSEKVYRLQSEWYHSVRQKFGLPLDSRHLYTKSDWQFFAAAVTSRKVREEIVQSIALWVNETVTDRPFSDLYETEGDGNFPGPNFFARPVVGGHFAFLALERACEGKAVAGLEFLDEESDEAKTPGATTVPGATYEDL